MRDTDTVPWREAFKDYTDEQICGWILRHWRCEAKMTQRQLAERSGISSQHISKIERGLRGMHRVHAASLAKALNIDWKILILDKTDGEEYLMPVLRGLAADPNISIRDASERLHIEPRKLNKLLEKHRISWFGRIRLEKRGQ